MIGSRQAIWTDMVTTDSPALLLFPSGTIWIIRLSFDSSANLFLAAIKQLYEWLSPSVRPSVTPFSLCSHHRIIMKISGVITNGRSDVHAKGQGQRSKVRITKVKTQFSRLQSVTPIWIYIWWWNEAQSLLFMRGTLLCLRPSVKFEAHMAKNRLFWAFPDCNSSLNSPMVTEWCTKLDAIWKRCPIIFQGNPSNFRVTRYNKITVLTGIESFRTVTPVCIQRWLWNDAQSLM